jgi:predicted nucleic acid-binding protein
MLANIKPEAKTGIADRLENFLAMVKYELVPDPPLEKVAAHVALVRDASDVPIVLAAATANADCLITTDPDLTNEETVKRVKERLGLRILRVGQFLDEVMGYSHDALTAIGQRRWEDLGETVFGEGT